MGLRINGNACVLVVLVIGVCIQSSSALKCWSCTSQSSTDLCANPHNSTQFGREHQITDCDRVTQPNYYSGAPPTQICRKIVQKENGRTTIRRMCDQADNDEMETRNGACGPHYTTSSHVTTISCHICNTDYCNGASSISGMQLIQASFIALTTFALSPSMRSFF